MNRREAIAAGAALLAAGCGQNNVQRVNTPQTPQCPCPPTEKTPPENAGLFICAFHLAKDNLAEVIPSYHYCSSLSEELHQCIIYDNNGKNARLIGIEYVISDKLYQALPAQEKTLWHPHKYEISAGILVTPGQPKDCEKKLMGLLYNTWGKTWHTWPDLTTNIPLGQPKLMWSANKDGEVPQAMIDAMAKKFGLDVEQLKRERKEYLR